MFDISWSEFLLVGIVALIVIGPKELPAVMRMVGHWTRKVRGMASEFQNQFQEAMREAEMTDLKKEVDDLTQHVAASNPLTGLRNDVESAGEQLKHSLASAPEAAPPLPAADGEAALTQAVAETPSEVFAMTAVPAGETTASTLEADGQAQAAPLSREMAVVVSAAAAEKTDLSARDLAQDSAQDSGQDSAQEKQTGDGPGRTE
ncbi:MAG: Sec-independent protein translocase protein TatB [Xanthobacteraceae bacterium]